jgi:DNA polymerase elongation subunit (family B)
MSGKEIAIDFETIWDERALPLIPAKGPREKTEPKDKLCFDSNYIKIAVAGFCFRGNTYSYGLDSRSEHQLLVDIWDMLGECDTIVTFNGLSFDVPLLIKRSWYLGVKHTKTLSLKRYDTHGNHVDIKAVLGNWDSYARGKLDLYAHLKLGKAKTEDTDGSKVQAMWDAGEFQKVHEYCQNDALLTWELFQSMKGYYL